MQFELLYDIIVISIETDGLVTIVLHLHIELQCFSFSSLCKTISYVSTFIVLCNYHEIFSLSFTLSVIIVLIR